MIKSIINLLPHLKGETENIQIAQGKYKLPTTFREGFKKLKREIQWLKK